MKALLPVFLLATSLSFAQIGTGGSTRIGGENSKWTFGGGVNVGFSGGSNGGGTTLGISPRVGYLISNDLDAGLSGGLTWSSNKYFSSTMVHAGPYVNYYISRSFYLTGSFQHYFINQKDKYTDYKYKVDESALFLGGGYMQRIGANSYLQIGLMYNVLYDENKSIFSSGLMPSGGIVFGI